MKSIVMAGVLLAACLLSTSSAALNAASMARATARIELSPDAGPVGTIFELVGSGFGQLSTGTVTFDGIDLGQISSDESGNIRGFFMVPDLRPGPARVRVTFDRTRAAASFRVLPPGA